MRASIVALLLAAALPTAHVSMAQQPAERSPEPIAPSQAQPISDDELDTFATIYVDLLQTVEKYKGEMQSAQTEEEATQIQGRMQEESVEKVAQHGWTPEKFNSIADAVNNDPALSEKAVKLIQQKS
jgi:hypothetical protein